MSVQVCFVACAGVRQRPRGVSLSTLLEAASAQHATRSDMLVAALTSKADSGWKRLHFWQKRIEVPP
jgi:hypothetical protein